LFAKTHENKPPAVGLRPDAPPYAVHGPYWVGTREIEVTVNADRVIPATIWYPALNPDELEESVVYSLGIADIVPALDAYPGKAIRDAAPDTSGGPYPLTVWSHGNAGTRYYAVYLQEHLASHGFVVIAIEHIGNAGRDSMVDLETLSQQMGLYAIQRPLDVTATIDFAESLTADGEMQGMVDLQRVAAMGLSFGGYTALAMAGARIDMEGFRMWCEAIAEQRAKEYQATLEKVGEMAALAGLDAVPEGLWPSLADPRVDAIVPIVPGLRFFGETSGNTVTVPTLMIAAGDDPECPPKENAFPVHRGISARKALIVFEHGTHGVSGGKMPVAWAAAMPEFGYQPVWDLDRAADLTDHFVTAFLLATLKGDTDAAAALAPDAVSFPGITYEEQGF
jgi:predicted dienelactone hydrolase